jgi:hypothetical protein
MLAYWIFLSMFGIRIRLIRIRIQHCRLNTDPDPEFCCKKWQKFKKIYNWKKIKFFLDQKLKFTIASYSIKDVQATGEAFSP